MFDHEPYRLQYRGDLFKRGESLTDGTRLREMLEEGDSIEAVAQRTANQDARSWLQDAEELPRAGTSILHVMKDIREERGSERTVGQGKRLSAPAYEDDSRMAEARSLTSHALGRLDSHLKTARPVGQRRREAARPGPKVQDATSTLYVRSERRPPCCQSFTGKATGRVVVPGHHTVVVDTPGPK